jgi:hypothetical protein
MSIAYTVAKNVKNKMVQNAVVDCLAHLFHIHEV